MTTYLTLSIRDSLFLKSYDRPSNSRLFMNERPADSKRKATLTLSDNSLRLDLIISSLKAPPEICFEGRSFSNISQLLRELPEVLDHPTVLAKLIHCVEIGLEYKYVEDPEAIKKCCECDAVNPPSGDRCYSFEHFDFSKIQKPFFSENTLVFFLSRLNVPYRVRCTFSDKSEPLEIVLEKLE